MECGDASAKEEGEEVEPVAAGDADIQPHAVVVPLRGGQATDPVHCSTLVVVGLNK